LNGHSVIYDFKADDELKRDILFLAMLSILFGQVVRGFAAGQRIFEVLDRRPEVDIHRGQELPSVDGKIEFYGVDFRYPTRKDVKVLDNISFTLESGTSTTPQISNACLFLLN